MSAAGMVPPTFEISRILEEQRRQDEKRRVKRAANRKSASTSRARKKALVDDMTAKNERMKQHALILSMLPDLVLAVCRSGEMTYVSPAAQWLLLHSPEEVTGANIFELVTPDCHALLRKMISDSLARPVAGRGLGGASSDEGTGRFSDCGSCSSSSGSDARRPTIASPPGNHRDRLQQRYLKGQTPGSSPAEGGAGGAKEGVGRGEGGWPGNTLPKGPKMLRLIRCDKTTVWCEARLSVRTERGELNPMPIEIILMLRTVSEGNKTAAGNGLSAAATMTSMRGAMESLDGTASNKNDNEEYVEDDDDGYRCEQEEDESNNSGSGNDSGRADESANASGRNIHGKSTLLNNTDVDGDRGVGGAKKQKLNSGNSLGVDTPDNCDTGPLEDGREERSLSNKRLRMENMSMFTSAKDIESPGSGKPGEGEDSSTGGDTGGSTTQEGSASCSNEEEGSNNGSKWGDACASNGSGDFGGSEDGSSDGSSTGPDLGEEVQSAVQSLILMGGGFSSNGGSASSTQ